MKKIILLASLIFTAFISNAQCVSTLAGTPPFLDGVGTQAHFHYPIGVAVDAIGNVYVADTRNQRIRKISPGGVVTTVAGSGALGYANGTSALAQFNNPSGVIIDALGNIYVADTGNHVIRKITSAGIVSTLAGSGFVGYLNGSGTSTQFNNPNGVAVDGSGNVYVADTGNQRIRKITPAGVVTTLAGSGIAGNTEGAGTSAQFNNPSGVAIDAAGNIFVADKNNHKIRKITPGGVVTTLAGSGTAGYADGTGISAQFNTPESVTVDEFGNVYLVDRGNLRIRKITPGGGVTTLAGSGVGGYSDGTGTTAQFFKPIGLAIDVSGNVYVADDLIIRKINASGVVNTFAGSSNQGFLDGNGAFARFDQPESLAVDALGNVYVADRDNNRIRKITPGGVVTTLAGSGTAGYADGTGISAQFSWPMGIVLDASSNIYVSDFGNHVIRKITPGGVVTTLAGSGTAGYVDGTGISAQFRYPSGVAIDAVGNILVADKNNHKIRKITPGGVVTTLAGSGIAGNTEGTGTSAQFYYPNGVAVDVSGNVYIADSFNNKIRKINPSGVVTTLAGSGTAGSGNGTGTSAQFNNPSGVAIDAAGNILVADNFNNKIRKITPGGVVTNYVGIGTTGYTDGIGSTAQFYYPSGVAIDGSGNLFVADWFNHLIRKITPLSALINYPSSSFCQSNTAQTVTLTGTGAYTGGAFSSSPSGLSINATTGEINPSSSNPGSYLVTYSTPNSNGCTVNTSTQVTINPNIEPTFDFQQAMTICQGSIVPVLPTTSSNGITGIWNPPVVNHFVVGTYVYTFTPEAGQCASPVVFIITVLPYTFPTFDPIPPICEGSTPPTLPLTSLNGIDGTWDPPTINTNIVGTQTYIFTPNANYCANQNIINISIVPSTSSTATISANPSICLGQNATINFNGTPNATVTYTVNGGANQTILLNANGNANLSANLTTTTTYSLVNVSLNGGCVTNLSGSATINVSSAPIINSPSPNIVCDENQDGYHYFDLTNSIPEIINGQSGLQVTFHETQLESQLGINPIPLNFPYYNIIPFSQNLYVRVYNVNSSCYSSTLLQLIVNPSPISPILNNLTACDNDSNPNDGMTTFNLTTQNQAILAANQNCQNCIITYHLSQSMAQSNSISIPNPTSYIGTSNQVIWFRIENSNGCYNFGAFGLQTSSVFTVNAPTTFNKCDSDANPNNGYTNFDLTTKDNEIKSGCTTCSVYYYPSNTDAINNSNIISNPNNYTNSVASVQSLGVRVVNIGGCIVNTILTIRVMPVPITNTNPTSLSPQCENTPGSGTAVFNLTTNATYIINGNSSYILRYYRTQADAIAGTNEITNPTACLIGSTAWIKVTNNFGCYVLIQQPLSVISFPANYATPSNVNSCSAYTLPNLPNGLNYYTGSNGTGTMLPNGTIINTSQTIYIYQQQCNSQRSFNITITPNITPIVNIIQPSCNMSVGQVQVTSPLGSQYEYSLDWDNFQTSPNFTVLTPGEHYLIVHLVQSDCYSEPLLVTINSMPMVTMSGTNNICAGEPANLYFYGTPNATVVFNANNGTNQSILIDDSGFAVYTSAPLTTNTSYNLVSITSGSVTCNQNLGNPVLVTVTTCIPNSGFHLNAFLDNNNNGIQDTGEVNVPFGQFHYQLNNTTHNVFSFSGTLDITENNPSTLYSFGFTINSAFSNYFIVNPLNYTNMHISSTGGITNINFAISISSFTDLSITNLPLSEPIPGFNYQHMLLYSNNGLLSASGNINFIKDPAVTMVNVSEPSALINSNGFNYNFTNLPPLQTGTIIATMYVPVLPNVSLGQLLITSASINSTSGGDAIPSNNTSSSYQFVGGSYDPNDIVESHGRNILHSSFSSEDYLYYTIRFENTGNANAINISIDNLLDSKLDESTLEMVSSSHNYIMDRISNTVNWKFNNIQLPPSVSNSNVGKGYVMYKIKPKTGYTVGDIIPNTAEIFFDTNPAVVTNTFENEFVSQLSIPEYSNNTVTVYPNPAKEQITIQLSPNNFIKQVELVDILGRIIMTKQYNSSNTTEILSLNEVENGTYLLEITTNDNQKATKKILVN